ncbi:MAG: DegV family protein [Chloroherpetonaceae bacterium]|nr:DegV family protein [Chloroherpetonaceae bacterium]MCS7211044.1 DegV family protein [Chloroherpetonaceae bacterium]MDW8019468.1 DegV family protein [Chloroherpetonaceae bacterium]MDW8464702.1 DegV family protein [Chloroherpetonaceae bacterium]
MRISIVTDSTCDLPQDLLFQYNIRQVPIRAVVQGKVSYDNYYDFDRDAFYKQQLDGTENAKFEAPTVDEFIQAYKKLCLETDMILSIHESSRLSETVKNARAAALAGMESMKKMRLQKNIGTPFQIRVIDSQSVSLGLGLLVLRAAELISRQVSFLRLSNALEKLAEQIFFYAVPKEPAYLRTAKEITKVSIFEAGLATFTDTKPVAVINKGQFKLIEKVKGYEPAIEHATKRALSQLQEKRSYEKVGFVYSGSALRLDEIAAVAQARAELAGMGLGSITSNMNPTLARYLGPGAVGIALINDDLSITDLAEIR